MKVIFALAAVTALGVAPLTSAHAAGCVSGAAIGGVAGHMAGHHGVLGAAAGCAVGHHENAKQQKNAAAASSAPATPAH